jgi:hypothetical protein
MTREEAEQIWNAAWEACQSVEKMRSQLMPDEGFACSPREWCFDSWAFKAGLPPRPLIPMITATGLVWMKWNAEAQKYEDLPEPFQESP